jgi:hypothetical protein
VRPRGGRRKQMEATPAIGRVFLGEPYFFSAPDNVKMLAQLSGSRASFYWGWEVGVRRANTS